MERRLKKRSHSMPDGISFENLTALDTSEENLRNGIVNESISEAISTRNQNFALRAFSYNKRNFESSIQQETLMNRSGLRRRALSEHGKSLLIEAWGMEAPLQFGDLKTTNEGGRKEKASSKSKRAKHFKQPKARKRSAGTTKGQNYFDILKGTHEKEAMKVMKQKGAGQRRRVLRSNILTDSSKLLEETVFEDDGWQTVSRAKAKPRGAKRITQPVPTVTTHEHEYEDMSEFHYMEEDVSDSRVWGRDKKSMQWKAVQQRNYSIGKRAAQRAKR